MPLTLYFHPLSSYCHKVLIALYDTGVPFTPRMTNLGDPADRAALTALWPMSKFPVLVDAARSRTVPESSIVIEYLAQHFPAAAPLLPPDADARLQVRLWDRVCDQYVMTPMQKIVADRLRADGERDARGVADARALLRQAYEMLERQLAGRTWLASDGFSLADCAAWPALFYATILEPAPPVACRTAGLFRAAVAAAIGAAHAARSPALPGRLSVQGTGASALPAGPGVAAPGGPGTAPATHRRRARTLPTSQAAPARRARTAPPADWRSHHKGAKQWNR
jgi:glutathione S-transferase